MIKKVNVLIVLTIIFMVLPIQAFASGLNREYDPPSDSDYYQKKISYQLYFSLGTVKVRMTQYKPGLPMDATNVIETVTWDVKENSYMWMDQQCKGALSFEYLDSNGNVVDSHVRGETTQYLNSGICSVGEVVKPSDFNETQNQYASDTFGGTATPLTIPSTADGSGGTGTTGFIGVDNGTGTGTDTGSSSSDCAACDMFSCPGWSDYMAELDSIKNAIPPAPNWDEVAGTFRDTIVPSMINDLGNLIGSAPVTPSVPTQLSGTDDRGINNDIPQMQDVPGLGEAGFDEGKIKNDAPVIEERQDPTGGFDLIQDPLSSLPDLPGDSFPKPGLTDPGDWGQNKPSEPDNPFPASPSDTGDPDTSTAPLPTDSGATPPAPGDRTGSAPIPGDTSTTPPSPSGDSYPGMKDYKPSPESPDGSGSDISP